MGLVTIIDIYCTYLLYILMYVSFTYPYMCCFFSLFMHMLLILVCNLLFLFHVKMPWWVLFKVFQKYRLSKSTCNKLSFCKVFQEFVLGYILLYSTSEYEFMTSLICSFVCCSFVTNCQRWTYVIHLLGTGVTILCNWLIFWQNALYLYFGRSRMCLILREILFQDQVLKPCKSVQDSSWKVWVH